MGVFDAVAFDEHEQLVFGCDRHSGLRAIIAVHDTTLGPGVGGCRMYPYAGDDAALDDVLRLSRMMTYKSALAGLPQGGGKSVIIGDPRTAKTPALLRAMGRFIDTLGGRYVAAEDSGTSVEDLRAMGAVTPHVTGIGATEHGGDPSPNTARGVFVAIRTALEHRSGRRDLAGLRVAVQGLGHVGYHLAGLLRAQGAQVLAADINADNLRRAVAELGVEATPREEILFADVDVLAPCALGGVLNAETIPRLRADIVAGAANNQLREPGDGVRLLERGILYCPDFLINAGGIIDVYYQRSGLQRASLDAHIERVGERLKQVLRRAEHDRASTQAIAEAWARELLRGQKISSHK